MSGDHLLRTLGHSPVCQCANVPADPATKAVLSPYPATTGGDQLIVVNNNTAGPSQQTDAPPTADCSAPVDPNARTATGSWTARLWPLRHHDNGDGDDDDDEREGSAGRGAAGPPDLDDDVDSA